MLTEKQIKVMKHCIGLDQKYPYKRHGRFFYKPWRNYYATGPECDGVDIWLDLEKQGYAVHGFAEWRWTFMLTYSGLDALGHALGVRIYDGT